MIVEIFSQVPGALADWLAGGIVTAILAVVALWWQIRRERAQSKIELRRMAVEEADSKLGQAEKAVSVVGSAMDELRRTMADQSERITTQDKRIGKLSERVTDLDKRHHLAISHIIDREWWAVKRWPGQRPEDLPAIPSELVADVQKLDPSLLVVERVFTIDEPDPI